MQYHSWEDNQYRVVSLDNLRAMCEHISENGWIVRVESASLHRVCVSFQKRGTVSDGQPECVILPCFRTGSGCCHVVLAPLHLPSGSIKKRLQFCYAFRRLKEMRKLYRNANGEWHTVGKILSENDYTQMWE